MKLLKTIMKRAKKARQELNLIFLDLAKVFDTVQHESIVKALQRKGVPGGVVDLIRDMYTNSTTVITTPEGKTRKIEINDRVKQGCPLSPLLLNLLMDELLDEIRSLNLGVKVGNENVGVMAFADDIILLADSEWQSSKLVRLREEFSNRKGLKVNAGKCLSMRMLPVKGKISLKVITEPHQWWKESALPTMDFETLSKYLGVRIDPDGVTMLPMEEWLKMFENIKKSPLKPEQKIHAIKTCIILKMTYQLRLSEVGITKLRKLNVVIKCWFKQILHLPEWTSDAWIHSPNGGGLGNILELILKTRKKASEKMCVSRDEASRDVGWCEDMVNERNLGLAKMNMSVNQMKMTLETRRMECLQTKLNGKALRTIAESYVKRQWLWYAESVKPGDKILMLKVMSGTLPTRINTSRGRIDAREKLCRKCKNSAETDLHVLSEYHLTKDIRICRHNSVVKKVVKEFKARYPTNSVQME